MQASNATSSIRRLFVSLDIHYNKTLNKPRVLKCRNKMKETTKTSC